MPVTGARSADTARPPGGERAGKECGDREGSGGELSLASVPHDNVLWMIGEYVHEYVGVAEAAGYRTGFVELVKTDTLIRSDVSRRLKDIDSQKPDLLLEFAGQPEGPQPPARCQSIANAGPRHEPPAP